MSMHRDRVLNILRRGVLHPIWILLFCALGCGGCGGCEGCGPKHEHVKHAAPVKQMGAAVREMKEEKEMEPVFEERYESTYDKIRKKKKLD